MKNKFLLALILGTLTLAGCRQQTPATPKENQETTLPETEINETSTETRTEPTGEKTNDLTGEIESINGEWNRYTNRRLGFSIEYPKTNFLNDSKQYQVKPLEDGNIVYLDEGYNTQEIEQNKNLTEMKKSGTTSFAILIKTINTDDQLENFIKERYGKACKLGKKEASNQEGVYNVGIENLTSPDVPEGQDCFVNYITEIKYSPEKGRVAVWNVGQDANFYDKDLKALDAKVNDSFKFL